MPRDGRARARPPALLVLLDPGRRLREPYDATPFARVDRSYRIYPAVFEPNFHELEYFVPIGDGPAAVAAMRELMLDICGRCSPNRRYDARARPGRTPAKGL